MENKIVRVFTSITKSYIPKARVLAGSLKKHHPDWKFYIVFSDSLPNDFSLQEEPFDEIILIEDLGIENLNSWIFKHNVVELCTAVKGFMADHLCKIENTQAVIYIDPDIMILNSLSPILGYLEGFEIILTPHLADPEGDSEGIVSRIGDELCTLRYGIYNLGFLAIKPKDQGLKFVKWWKDRLNHFCYDELSEGLFTDQKWCDLVPALFDKTKILHDRGYNVATWNLQHRLVKKDEKGNWLVNGSPLRFYHFTGYDSGAGEIQLNLKAKQNKEAIFLWKLYKSKLEQSGHGDPRLKKWKYDYFNNGEKITFEMRKLYRRRQDLVEAFRDPFNTLNNKNFLKWFKVERSGNLDNLRKVFKKLINLSKKIKNYIIYKIKFGMFGV